MVVGEVQQTHQDLGHIDNKLQEVNIHLQRLEKQNQEIISLLKQLQLFKC